MANQNFPGWGSGGTGGGGVSTDASLLTADNESSTLPNSKQLIAGTNITFDVTNLNELIINASGTGGGITTIAQGGTNSSTALNDNRVMISKDGKIVEGVEAPLYTFYVDTVNGDDTWSGTENQPFQTIGHALSFNPINYKIIKINAGSTISEDVIVPAGCIASIVPDTFGVEWSGSLTVSAGSAIQIEDLNCSSVNKPFVTNHGAFLYKNCNITTSYDNTYVNAFNPVISTILCDEAVLNHDLGNNVLDCIYNNVGTGTQTVSCYLIQSISVNVVTKIKFFKTSIFNVRGLPYNAVSGIIYQNAYTPPVHVEIFGTGLFYRIYDIPNAAGTIGLFHNNGISHWDLVGCIGKVESVGTSPIVMCYQDPQYTVIGSRMSIETTFNYSGQPVSQVTLGSAITGTVINLKAIFYTPGNTFPALGGTNSGTYNYFVMNGVGNIAISSNTLQSAGNLVTFPNTASNTIVPSTAPTNQFANGIGSDGVINYLQVAFSDLSGPIAASQQNVATSANLGAVRLGTDIGLNGSNQLTLAGSINGKTIATTDQLVGQQLLTYDPVNNIFTDTVILNTALNNLNNAIINAINGNLVSEAVAAATTNVVVASPGATVDGVTLNVGDTILLTANGNFSENGLWIYNGATVPLTRSPKMNTWAQVNAAQVFINAGGTSNGGTVWRSSSEQTGTVGTTSITFIKLPSGEYQSGTNISVVGNTVNTVASPNFTSESLSSNTNFQTIGTGANKLTVTMATLTAPRTLTYPDGSSSTVIPSTAPANQVVNGLINGILQYIQLAFSNLSGTATIAQGGTGQTTALAAFNALSPMTTVGDLIYGGTSGSGTRLPGNITTAKLILTQTGNGTTAGNPTWDALTSSTTVAGLNKYDGTSIVNNASTQLQSLVSSNINSNTLAYANGLNFIANATVVSGALSNSPDVNIQRGQIPGNATTPHQLTDAVPTNGADANYIINSNFAVAQRGTSLPNITTQTKIYTVDNYYVDTLTGAFVGTVGISLGTTGNSFPSSGVAPNPPTVYAMVVQVSAYTSGTAYLNIPIEDVQKFSGRICTFSFWCHGGATPIPLIIDFVQYFGTGGAPAATTITNITNGTTTIASSAYQRSSFTFTAPTVLGKTYGSNLNSANFIRITLPNFASQIVFANFGFYRSNFAPPYVVPHQADIWTRCQRFYQIGRAQWNGMVPTAATAVKTLVNLASPMRTSTLSTSATATNIANSGQFDATVGTMTNINNSSFYTTRTTTAGAGIFSNFEEQWAISQEITY